MNVTPFRWLDLWRFEWQPAQQLEAEFVTHRYAEALQAGGPAFTFAAGDRVVACGGFVAHGAAADRKSTRLNSSH